MCCIMAGVVGIIVYRVVNPNSGNGDASANTGSTAWNSQVYSANQNNRCVHSATEPPKVESKQNAPKVDSTRKMRPARYSRRHEVPRGQGNPPEPRRAASAAGYSAPTPSTRPTHRHRPGQLRARLSRGGSYAARRSCSRRSAEPWWRCAMACELAGAAERAKARRSRVVCHGRAILDLDLFDQCGCFKVRSCVRTPTCAQTVFRRR